MSLPSALIASTDRSAKPQDYFLTNAYSTLPSTDVVVQQINPTLARSRDSNKNWFAASYRSLVTNTFHYHFFDVEMNMRIPLQHFLSWWVIMFSMAILPLQIPFIRYGMYISGNRSFTYISIYTYDVMNTMYAYLTLTISSGANEPWESKHRGNRSITCCFAYKWQSPRIACGNLCCSLGLFEQNIAQTAIMYFVFAWESDYLKFAKNSEWCLLSTYLHSMCGTRTFSSLHCRVLEKMATNTFYVIM